MRDQRIRNLKYNLNQCKNLELQDRYWYSLANYIDMGVVKTALRKHKSSPR